MVSLRLQKRLASAVMKVGKKRVWFDPNETSEISMASSRRTIRKLVSDGLIVKKNEAVHSRARARAFLEERRKGMIHLHFRNQFVETTISYLDRKTYWIWKEKGKEERQIPSQGSLDP